MRVRPHIILCAAAVLAVRTAAVVSGDDLLRFKSEVPAVEGRIRY